MKVDVSGSILGDPISGSILGGEYLGWTGFPGFKAQAAEIPIGHLRWPGGINAEDRIDTDGYAYDLSTTSVVDNWETWNGSPKAGLSETMEFARDHEMSFSMIVPTARYVEAAMQNYDLAIEWLQNDLAVFTNRLATNHFGQLPPITLEVGAEYYSTNIWEDNSGSLDVLALFSNIFAEVVVQLSLAEDTYGEMYDVAVQMGRFQSRDDPTSGERNGEAADSLKFIEAFVDYGVDQKIDSVIWHRYTERYDQIDDAFRQQIHPENEMSTLLPDHLSLWQAGLQNELDLVVSWLSPNVDSSGQNENSAFDHGPQSAHNILQMFSEVAAAGADIATVYGMDIQWPGSLSFGSPDSPDIYYGGAVYGLVAESVVGLSVTDAYKSNTLAKSSENEVLRQDHANFFVFEGEGKAVIFVAAGNLVSENLLVSFDYDLMEQFNYARVTTLTPNGEGAFATATKSHVAPIDFSADEFIFDFSKSFEVARVELFEEVPIPTGDQLVDTYYEKDGSTTQVIGSSIDVVEPTLLFDQISESDNFAF